jgi:hypothetical protein
MMLGGQLCQNEGDENIKDCRTMAMPHYQKSLEILEYWMSQINPTSDQSS